MSMCRDITFVIGRGYLLDQCILFALVSHASKVMLNILQARLQQYVNCELPNVQAGFRKCRGTRDQIANICWIIEKAKSFRKTSISALLTMPKPLTVWVTTNCGKFFKRWEYQNTWSASWEICMQVRKFTVYILLKPGLENFEHYFTSMWDE